MKDKLRMFFSTPGLMSYDDLVDVEYFLTKFKHDLDSHLSPQIKGDWLWNLR